MNKKLVVSFTFFFIFFQSICIKAQDFKYIEIFDPKQDKVVKVVQSSPEIQNMVASWITNIQGIYGKIDPITDDGYAVKIPLNPAAKVNSSYLNAIVNEVYIIIPEKAPPFYMIFEDKNKLSCYPFNGNIDMLSKSLGFKLNNKR